MAAGSFIKWLPTATGGRIPVTVAEGDITDAEIWDRDIQWRFITGTNRIDADWSWRTNYLRAALVEDALKRELAFFQIRTPDASGDVFTVGQMLVVNGFHYPPESGQKCIFLWYLAGAPETAAIAYGVPACKGVLSALVDTALQFSHMRGFTGRVLLHASPDGSDEQRAELFDRYRKAGLKTWTKGGFRWLVGRARLNDGRYFYADSRTAAKMTLNFDAFR